jgi:hypothetical protein
VFLAVFICTVQTILAARNTLLATSTKKAQIQSVFGINNNKHAFGVAAKRLATNYNVLQT